MPGGDFPRALRIGIHDGDKVRLGALVQLARVVLAEMADADRCRPQWSLHRRYLTV